METMPDDAEHRALHEMFHPDDYELDPRAYAPEVPSYAGPRDGRGDYHPAGTDSSVASGSDLQRIVNAPEGVLPSDLVPSPTVENQYSNYVTMCVVMLALLVTDIIA